MSSGKEYMKITEPLIFNNLRNCSLEMQDGTYGYNIAGPISVVVTPCGEKNEAEDFTLVGRLRPLPPCRVNYNHTEMADKILRVLAENTFSVADMELIISIVRYKVTGRLVLESYSYKE